MRCYAAHILFCTLWKHSLQQRHILRLSTIYSFEIATLQLLAHHHRTTYGYRRYSISFRPLQHSPRSLAHKRLRIDTPFARNNEFRAYNPTIKVLNIEHSLHATLYTCAK